MCKALEDELCENQAHTQDTTSCKQVACKMQKKKMQQTWK